jgi:uncharacterized protein (TIGR02118 family)
VTGLQPGRVAPVIKLVMAIRRRDDVAPEEFHRYWLEEHGPLARRLLEPLDLRRYVQTHTLDTDLNGQLAAARGTVEAFDGVAELWWDSLEDLLATVGSEDGQRANAALAEDEARFIDLKRSSLFLTEEQVIFDGGG